MCLADCKKPRVDASAPVPVPGWECTWDEDECNCTPLTDAGTSSKHASCENREYETCVASHGMSRTPLSCTCMTGKSHPFDGGTWVRSYKLGDGDERVTQCPPIPTGK